jgi:hypothetical protein
MANPKPTSRQTVSAREFRLLDKNGKMRAFLGMDESGGTGAEMPVFTLLDEAGKARLSVGIGEKAEPVIMVYDSASNPSLILRVTEEGTVQANRPFHVTMPADDDPTP